MSFTYYNNNADHMQDMNINRKAVVNIELDFNGRPMAFQTNVKRPAFCDREYIEEFINRKDNTGIWLIEIINSTKGADFFRPIMPIDREQIFTPRFPDEFKLIEKYLREEGHKTKVIFKHTKRGSKCFPVLSILNPKMKPKPFQIRIKTDNIDYPNGLPLVKEEFNLYTIGLPTWQGSAYATLMSCNHFLQIDNKVFGYNLRSEIAEVNRVMTKQDKDVDLDKMTLFMGSKPAFAEEIKAVLNDIL